MFIDAHEDRFDRHVAPNSIVAKRYEKLFNEIYTSTAQAGKVLGAVFNLCRVDVK